MKKILILICVLLLGFTSIGYCVNPPTDLWSSGQDRNIVIDSSGNVIPNVRKYEDQSLGDEVHQWSYINVSSYVVSLNGDDKWVNLAEDTTSSIYSTVLSSLPSQVLANDTIVQPVYGRNLVCSVVYSVGTPTQTISVSWTIAGFTQKGDEIEEVVTSTATEMSNLTNNAFCYISSVTYVVTSSDEESNPDCWVNIGVGNKIGLSDDVTSISHVYKVIEAGADVPAGSVSIDVDYDTVEFATDPQGSNEQEIYYKVRETP